MILWSNYYDPYHARKEEYGFLSIETAPVRGTSRAAAASPISSTDTRDIMINRGEFVAVGSRQGAMD